MVCNILSRMPQNQTKIVKIHIVLNGEFSFFFNEFNVISRVWIKGKMNHPWEWWEASNQSIHCVLVTHRLLQSNMVEMFIIMYWNILNKFSYGFLLTILRIMFTVNEHNHDDSDADVCINYKQLFSIMWIWQSNSIVDPQMVIYLMLFSISGK